MRLYYCLICLLLFNFIYAQQKTSVLEATYFYGNILKHKPDMAHLISGHPSGVMASYSVKTYGEKAWQSDFNYPDYGVTFSYQDFKSELLGENYSLNAHVSFYFLDRNIMMRLGQGIAYNTNPYDKRTNNRNNALGSHILSSTFFMLDYKKEHLFDDLGVHAGVLFTHYSNGSFKAPNLGINSIMLNLGVSYQLDDEKEFQPKSDSLPSSSYAEPVQLNVAFYSGFNENDVIGSGQYPFYVPSLYLDKRLNKKSSVQLGVEAFFSLFIKEYIKYRSIAFPGYGINGDEDYKRFAVFLGHELHMGNFSFLSQIGYYFYDPIAYGKSTYQRIGLKYYISKDIFTSATLKTHFGNAEAIEFGVGIRL